MQPTAQAVGEVNRLSKEQAPQGAKETEENALNTSVQDDMSAMGRRMTNFLPPNTVLAGELHARAKRQARPDHRRREWDWRGYGGALSGRGIAGVGAGSRRQGVRAHQARVAATGRV